ncbi:hypothetical protein KP509_16G009200 [Ceratopteris richardii]|uniref:Uncharacterized protein n=2 Tax=Ceratopteris richardii TaxID=49495 RepID=A0A8T2T0V2_CERRI|nr:hypothetical protein KP509_16G009200 [Ceratopteris richardii]
MSQIAQDMLQCFKRTYCNIQNIVPKHNNKWQVNWSSHQWRYRFRLLWAFSPIVKQALLLWSIMHKESGLAVGQNQFTSAVVSVIIADRLRTLSTFLFSVQEQITSGSW